MFITETKYINRFKYNGKYPETLNSFKKHALVRSSRGIMKPLSEYPMDTQNVIAIIVIFNKNNILSNFYNRSLSVNNISQEFPPPMKITQLSNMKQSIFKNIPRNLHYLGVLKNTDSELENLRSYLDVLDDLFKRWIIDYKLVTPSAIYYFKNGAIGSILSSYFFRASIMNPYLVYSILSHYVRIGNHKKWKLFTPTLGWSSYLFGASQCKGLTQYTGIDVLPDVCKKTLKIGNDMGINTEIICKKSELVARDKNFMKRHRNTYDFVYFSPPYYKLELYSNVMDEYTSFDKWIDEYWKPTIDMCWKVLKKGGKLMFILSLYGDLKDQLNTMLSIVGNKHHKYKIQNNVSNVNKNISNIEYLYVFS